MMDTHRRFRCTSLFALLIAAVGLSLLAACLSPKYKRADKNTPAIQPLNVKFPSSTLQASLYSEISDGGPGSWKRQAFWDEYIVIVHNESDQTVIIDSAALTDYAGTVRPVGDDPWALERESKTLERRYREAGIDFARMAAPRVIVTAAEPGVLAGAGIGTTGAAALASASVIALPVYGVTVFSINMHNKAAIKKEFNRRRLALPITLRPGEARAGSLFFPMVPNPRTLSLRWTCGEGETEIVLDLHFLAGLHVTGSQP